MKLAAGGFFFLLYGINALPAGSASNAGWLSTAWDVIVVGKLLFLPSEIETDRSSPKGAGPAGIVVADRMSETGLKT